MIPRHAGTGRGARRQGPGGCKTRLKLTRSKRNKSGGWLAGRRRVTQATVALAPRTARARLLPHRNTLFVLSPAWRKRVGWQKPRGWDNSCGRLRCPGPLHDYFASDACTPETECCRRPCLSASSCSVLCYGAAYLLWCYAACLVTVRAQQPLWAGGLVMGSIMGSPNGAAGNGQQ